MTVLITIGIILALLGLIFSLPAKMCVRYKNGEDETLEVVAAIGFIRFTIYDTSRDASKEKKDEKEKSRGSRNPKESLGDIKKKFEEVLDILSFLRDRMIIYNFKFYSRIGTGDAALTGIATGAAWGVLYDILAVCDRYFVLKKHDIRVAPDFLNEIFLIDFEAVAGFKTAYDLWVARKFLIPKREKGEVL